MKKVLALILVAALMPLPALAQQAAGKVTTLDGTANVARATAPQTPATLKDRDDVFVRDRITTGNESLVKMLMGGKALITVRELSALTITEETGKAVVQLDNGKIAYGLLKNKLQPGETHEIRTPNAIASVRGTVLIVEVEQKSAQGPGGGPVPWTTFIDVLPPPPGQPPPVVFGGLITGGPQVQILGGRGRTIIGGIIGPDRPARPDAVLLAGLHGKGKRQGSKPKPDPNAVTTDMSALGGGGAEALLGSSTFGAGSRVLPGGKAVYVP